MKRLIAALAAILLAIPFASTIADCDALTLVQVNEVSYTVPALVNGTLTAGEFSAIIPKADGILTASGSRLLLQARIVRTLSAATEKIQAGGNNITTATTTGSIDYSSIDAAGTLVLADPTPSGDSLIAGAGNDSGMKSASSAMVIGGGDKIAGAAASSGDSLVIVTGMGDESGLAGLTEDTTMVSGAAAGKIAWAASSCIAFTDVSIDVKSMVPVSGTESSAVTATSGDAQNYPNPFN